MSIQLRLGTVADAERIAPIHFSAVHETASPCYSAQVLDSWSPLPDKARCAQVRQAIEYGEEVFVMAEIDGLVQGFGSVVPARQELRAVYVEPACGRRGVGSAILQRVEQIAAARGACRLQMDASLNAEPFYLKHDYSVVSRGVHRLSSGAEMACVRMSKEISSKGLTAP